MATSNVSSPVAPKPAAREPLLMRGFRRIFDFLAWVVLFLHPGETDRRFAWTIDSRMTAMVMGAGYGSAIYFFVRVVSEHRWHRVGLGFLPITVFTWMMLGTTFLHWDRFRHGSFPFELWFWIYLITPVLVPVVRWATGLL